MMPRTVIDVSRLPTYTFGHRSPVWWGAVAYMLIDAPRLRNLILLL